MTAAERIGLVDIAESTALDGICDECGPIFHAASLDGARTMARRHVVLHHPDTGLDQAESVGTGAER